MKIVAFLQNQWFNNPERVRQIFLRQPEAREFYIAAFLFMGCLTGRRLQKVFGEQLCEQIIWEEQSPQIGGKASSKFPADACHIRRVIAKHKPDIILAFGQSAKDALLEIRREGSCHESIATWKLIIGPHPAARMKDLPARLEAMRRDVDSYIARNQVSAQNERIGDELRSLGRNPDWPDSVSQS